MNKLLYPLIFFSFICCGDNTQEVPTRREPVASEIVLNGEKMEAYLFYDINISGKDIIFVNGKSEGKYMEIYLYPSDEDQLTSGIAFRWIQDSSGTRNQIDFFNEAEDTYFNTVKDVGQASLVYNKDTSVFQLDFQGKVIDRSTGETLDLSGSQSGTINWVCFELIGHHVKYYVEWEKNAKCVAKYRDLID